jgi:levanase
MQQRARLLAVVAAHVVAGATAAPASAAYDEPYRPQFHFSPAKNWMNDPNGLVYYQGEYHLFFQYNPFGDTWGHMSWGHAVSRDLVHWQNLPVAIPARGDELIFSGSAVVDKDNSSGFGKGRPPLVAAFTSTARGECVVFSTDRGRTWARIEAPKRFDSSRIAAAGRGAAWGLFWQRGAGVRLWHTADAGRTWVEQWPRLPTP